VTLVSVGPPIFDRHIPALVITGSTEAATECLHKVCCCAGRRGVHVANDGHSRLLRARRERPRRCRAAEQRDELAADHLRGHSMTSSAATSRPGGTVKPSAFAVFKLMTVSNLVGACTGRSAGLSPRKIRSTEEAASRNISTWAVP